MPATVRSYIPSANAGATWKVPAFAEGMYDRTVAGMSKASTLEVVKP